MKISSYRLNYLLKVISIIILLIIITRFFGFTNISSTTYNFALIFYLLIFSLTVNILNKKILIQEIIILIITLIYFCYGVFKPVIDDNSLLRYSFSASWEFASWLFIIFWSTILNINLKSKNLDLKCSWAFTIFAYALSIILISNFLFDINLSGYIKIEKIIHIHMPSILPVAFFLTLIKLIQSNNSLKYTDFIGIILIIIGIYLESHRSIFFGILIGFLLFSLIRISKKLSLTNNIFFFSFLLIISFLLLDAILFLLLKDDAFASRFYINEYRFIFFKENPFFGYGFIDPDSKLGNKMFLLSNNRFTETFGSVDFGYLDLFLKFGLFGGFLFLFFLLWIAFKAILSNDLISQLAGSFLIALFFINITWSMFLYPNGIFLTSLLITIINIRGKIFIKDAS